MARCRRWGHRRGERGVRAANPAKGQGTGRGPANITSRHWALRASTGTQRWVRPGRTSFLPQPRQPVLVHGTFQALRCLGAFTHAVQDRPVFPLPARRPRLDPWVRKLPWSRERQPTAVFSPGECHGRRSLAGWPHHSSLLAPSPLSTQQSDCLTRQTGHKPLSCSRTFNGSSCLWQHDPR